MLHLFWMTAIVTFILGLIFGAVGHAVLQPVFKMAQHE